MKRAKALQREADRTNDRKLSFDLSRQAWDMKRRGSALDVLLAGQLGEFGTVLDYFYRRVGRLPDQVKPDDPALEPLAAAADVARTSNFMGWELAFPNVWRNWRSAAPEGGFDAVIGNPPWDRLKMQEVEWFAARQPEIAFSTNASRRKAMVAALKADGDSLADEYDRASRFAAMAGRMANLAVDKGGQYPLLGGGDVNLYSLFVERAQRLVRPEGLVGLLTPSGIAGDLGASRFFKSVTTGRLRCLLDYANRPAPGLPEFFGDVDSRFKFCAIVFGGQKRTFTAAECGFFLTTTADAGLGEATFPLTPADFAAVNPNSGTAPVFRTPRDADLTTAIYARLPVLVRHGKKRGDMGPDKAAAVTDLIGGEQTSKDLMPWPVKYTTMFHMTNDSHLFRTRADLEADGWYPVAGGRWKKGEEREAVPLYVGRMFWHFDHRASNVLVNEENLHNAALSEAVSINDKQNPAFTTEPQYRVEWSDVEPQLDWALAFRDITNPTNERTMISAILPGAAYGNTACLLLPNDARVASTLMANLNSFALDYVARQKLQGTHANWYIVEQLPVIPTEGYDRTFGRMTARQIVAREVLHLTYTAHDMAPFARDMGWVEDKPLPFRGGEEPRSGGGVGLVDDEGGRTAPTPAPPLKWRGSSIVKPPFVWDESDRRQRRARLDALYFHLYGIGREDADYILSTFPIVRRNDERDHGRYLTRDLILAHMAALAAGDTEAIIRIA